MDRIRNETSDHMVLVAWIYLTVLIVRFSSAEYIEPGPKYPCPQTRLFIHPCQCVIGNDVGLTVLCENSNLASLAIGLSNLASARLPIENLIVSHCNISYMYGDIFYSLSVKKLFIKHVPLYDMNQEIFLGVGKSIKEVHLYNTQLSVVPSGSLLKVTDLKILNISSHAISSLADDAFPAVIYNSVEKLYITNGNISTVQQETFKQFKKLKTLDLHGNTISSLQRNQFKGMKDVEMLDLSSNQIEKIDSSHFAELSKMSHFNASHNLLTDIPRGTFTKNTVLKLLNLSYNKLKKVDANMFRGLRLLRILLLSNNEITQVDRGTFDTISRIGIIDLSGNKITKIDYQMFSELRYVEKIDVSRNLVSKIEKLAFKNLYLTEINLSRNNISIIEKGAFEGCVNITVLDMSHNAIADFERSVFDDLSYATEFRLEFNNLTDLSKVPLGNMTGLKILNVTYNQLSVIPRNTFPKLYELHTIDLSNNLINKISGEVFQPLLGLRYLNLTCNHLTKLDTHTFSKITTLLELSLNENNISTIARDTFFSMFSLQTLDLSGNAIEEIFLLPNSMFYLNLSNNAISYIEPRSTWPTMNTLVELDLSRNFLADSLQENAFANLLVLQRLSLAYNSISEPPKDSLRELTSLRYLDMRGNNIERLSRAAFGELPVVFELDLTDNQISEIEDRAFSGLLQLRDLSLRNNNLSSIPNDVFTGLYALNTLDLSQNHIENIDNKTMSLFEDCRSLKMLNMSHNLISSLSKNSFPTQETLRVADFSYNQMPILTTDFTSRLKKLYHLNFSNNAINEIRNGVFENLTSLQSFDLSYNEFSSISTSNKFHLPSNLSELRLAHNYLNKLPVKSMVHQRKLKLLDVSDNLLPFFLHDLMKLIESGSTILYSGNPILCNCNLRPLQRWLASQLHIRLEFQNLTCIDYFETTANKSVARVAESDMYCDLLTEEKYPEFEITPDVKFRDITRTKDGTLIISWYVPKNREDIAGFVLETVNKSHPQQIFYKKTLPYFARNEILKPRFSITKEAEICLIAATSNGTLRSIVPNQCRNLASVLPYASGHCIQSASQQLLISVLTSLLLYYMYLCN